MYSTRRLFSLFVVLSLMITTFQSCTDKSNAEDKPKEEKVDSTSIVPVEATVINKGNVSAYYSTTATLNAESEAQVVAQLGGVINEIFVEEGQYVQKGQKLAQLDDRQYRLEVQRAKVSLNKLKNDFKRNEELYNKKLISFENFDNAKFQYEQQKANLELAELNLAFTTVKAPISGYISNRLVKIGNTIGLNAPMFQVTSFDELHAIVFIPEHELNKIKQGQEAQISVDAFKETKFNGKVLRISPTVDPQTGTFKTTIVVSDDQKRLMPGMFSRINIQYDTHLNTLLVDKKAIAIEDGTESLYVIKNGKSYKRSVKTGFIDGNRIELASTDLAVGDTVVTIGQNSLKDSAVVDVISMK